MNISQRRYDTLRRMVERRLALSVKRNQPRDLAEACRYVLSAGGKRVRSVLVLLSCEAVGGKAADALDAAVAVELLHNFTLVHDDIMDNAPTRRGQATVHTRWDVNHALLVGDVLLGLSYRQLLCTRMPHLDRALRVFTEGFIDVCEGQALDVEFERRSDVTVPEYFRMIEKKTGRLISTSTELGAIIGQGKERHIAALRRFGALLGRAFQLQDDLLDVVANEENFGKVIGGDILEGKKTFLLLKALERATGNQRKTLMHVMNRKSAPRPPRPVQKDEVQAVTAIYASTGALDSARQRIRRDTEHALEALSALPETSARAALAWLAQMLVKRTF